MVIPRSYVSHGFRERAEGLATELLGPRLEPDRLDRAVKLERFTELDRDLLSHTRGGEVALAHLPDEAKRASRLVQRLNRLEELGLAEQARPGAWRMHADLEEQLTRLADRRERERATARLLAHEDRGLQPERTRELEAAHSSQRVTGRLVGLEQLGDDVRGPHLVGVEGVDGKFWTARVGRLDDLRGLTEVERGAIVQLDRATPEMRASDRTIWEIAEKDWDEVLDTNLKGTFLCMRAVAKPMMKQRSGRIINMASVIGLIGNSGQANYAASKAGIIALTKSVAKELGSRNVLINAIAPGFIDTEMTQALSDDIRNAILKSIPVGVLGKPADVARAALFLASEDSRFIAGQVITVDGGMVM